MEVRKLSDNSLVYSSVTADDGSVTETAFGKTYTRKTNDDSYTQSTGQTVKSGTVTKPRNRHCPLGKDGLFRPHAGKERACEKRHSGDRRRQHEL